MDFLRHGSGVRWVLERAALAVDSVRAAVRHRRALGLAIPCRVASQQSSTPFHQATTSIPSLSREQTSTRLRDFRLWMVLQSIIQPESHSRATENYPESRGAAQVVRLPRGMISPTPEQRPRSKFRSIHGPTVTPFARSAGAKRRVTIGCRPGGSDHPSGGAPSRCGRSRCTSCMPCDGSTVRRAVSGSRKFLGATERIN